MAGEITAIHVAHQSGQPVEAREEATVVAGRGLRGDRHFVSDGTEENPPGAGEDLTLIESEAVAAIAGEADIHLDPGAHRRNVTTAGVALNHLVGERFRIGDAVVEGVKLCEPCRHLETLTEEGLIGALLHRGGLRADVVESGTIRVGDRIERP